MGVYNKSACDAFTLSHTYEGTDPQNEGLDGEHEIIQSSVKAGLTFYF